jgi:hypothetical protein
MTIYIELTQFAKSNGPLTKTIRLNGDGSVHSDSSACLMAGGTAQRLKLAAIGELAATIERMKPNEALSLGRMRPDLPDQVKITTKAQQRLNGAAQPDVIVRTADNLMFVSGAPALALIDHDAKGMPPKVAERIVEQGGFEAALQSILPELGSAARLFRASTSAGLFRADTGERLPGSSGVHGYVAVRDGTDIDRFLKTLHARCWLAGFGWYVVGTAGQLLERSIVDRVVGSPERLIFEGAPIIEPPLAQDSAARCPVATTGELLDTATACPPLSKTEEAQFQKLRAREAARLDPEAAKARAAFVASQAERIVQRTGMSTEAAERIVEQQCRGVLLPDVELPFDDAELAGKTVADVLTDSERFVGETLADPVQGVEHGRCRAKIMRRADGTIWIHSFAHGNTAYELKADASGAGPPTIRVQGGLRHEATDAGLAALQAANIAFYQRDKTIVRVCMVPAKTSDGEVTYTPGIAEVGAAFLGRELGRVARWEKIDQRGKPVRIDPPRAVAEQIIEMAGEWPFPPLAGVIGTPTMRPDTTLLLAEGYDARTGLVLLGAPPMPPIPEEPTRAQAEEALWVISSLLVEFPFRDGDGDTLHKSVDLAVALSELITPVVRGAMPVAPMHLASAPQAGTGKSYLADIASTIATGERAAVVAFSPSPEETEKRINGAALAGHPIIALDNASGDVQGDLLCQLTERPLLQLRKLGKSDQFRVSNAFCVFVNGNNAVIADDLVRRTIACWLDANMEAPETRSFKDNPLAKIRCNRGRYIAACLTIVRAYICAGKPERLNPLASYEPWSDLVRAPLVWLGCADPVASMSSLRSADPVRRERTNVFHAWADELGTGGAHTTAELIKNANERELGALTRPNLRSALIDVAQDRRGEIDPKRLGKWLAKTENTISGRLKLTVDRGDSKRPRWVLRSV